jgi:ribosomal protein S7
MRKIHSKISKKTFYTKLLGFLTKKGKKSVSRKILNDAFLEVAIQTNLSLYTVFIKVFFSLNSFVETKKVKIRRTSHIVPFGITFKRRSYLIIKWLLEVVSQDKRKVSTSKKLATELLNIVKNKTISKAMSKKTQNISQAINNRSNIHYRW